MNTIHILHVETSADFSDLLSTVITQEGDHFEMISERRATDALERVADTSTPVDCIISDFGLPGMDGLEFLEAVRQEHPNLPFILFTGRGSESIASEAISAGATDYLQKGEGTESYKLLANRIENFVEQYRSQRERTRVYQALETATEGIGLLDEDNRYIYLNEAYATLYGYEREELIGEHWSKLYPESEIQRFDEDILPKLERNGAWDGQSYGQRASGMTFREQLSLTQLQTGGHVCVVRDITEQQQQKRQFEAVIDNLQGMVYRCKNDPELSMQQVQGNVDDLLGYSTEELQSQEIGWMDIIHPADREYVWETIQEELESGGEFDVTYRIVDSDENITWVMERGHGIEGPDGAVERLEGLITDVTDRKRRERELELKTKAMDEAPMGIVLSNPSQDDNPLVYANDHFQELTGYENAIVQGQNCRFLQGPLTSEATIEQLQTAIENREPVATDILNYRSDGTPFWNHVQISPIFDSDGTLMRFVGFQADVTSRVEHERRIEVLNRVLLHTIRNNLNVLLGSLSTLEDNPTVDRDTVETIREPATRLLESSEKARQIESLLESASFHPERIDLESRLLQELSDISEEFDSVEIQTKLETEQTVLAPACITVAFQELFENAIVHATIETPSLTVTTETKTVAFPSTGHEKDAVVIHIEDENRTIPDLERTRLLGDEESPVHHGSGLGMWLINWLVTMSGGLLSHTAREPRGNRISITLLQGG